MKRFIYAIFSLAFLMFFGTSCSKDGAGETDNGKKIVYCTTYPIYMFARNVAENSPGTEVRLLIPPDTGCPHDYSLTPDQMLRLAKKNTVLIKNGAGLDDVICSAAGKANRDIVIYDSSKDIEGKESHADEDESCDGVKCNGHSHEGHAHESEINPHFFASPFKAREIVKNIADALCDADPENAGLYRKNETEYLARIDKLCDEFAASKNDLSKLKFAIQHDVFDYLASELEMAPAVYLHIDGETAPSAAALLKIVKKIKDENVSVIFTEKQYPSKLPERLAKESSVKFDTLDSFATGDIDAPLDSYEKAMRSNLEKFKGHIAK